ncbi:hypothetical protein [Gracilimonas amylolytica]|jgi:predicted transcriptional regulator|uniref:hypothetical protein n=1 Tax=Gracilimonas amylolytica TaxID=1749045 RepID=UPI000CD8AC3B|nr:hypothetical protein [Gracilimonas amylolytica]
MPLQEKDKKLEIINFVSETNDSEVINAIHDLLADHTESTDFWDELSPDQRSKIEEGLRDIEKGKVVSHKDVKAKYGI